MDREVDAMGYGICIFSADTVQDFLKREKIRKRKLLSLLQKDKELYLSTQKEGILIALVGINAYNYAIRLEGRDEPFDDRWVQKIDYDGFNLEIKDGLWISNIRQLEPFEPKIYHEKEEEFYTTPGQFEPVERYSKNCLDSLLLSLNKPIVAHLQPLCTAFLVYHKMSDK